MKRNDASLSNASKDEKEQVLLIEIEVMSI